MMRPIALLAVLGTLVGCTTPGLNYNTTLMASSPAAAATRNVSVSHFAGPAGGWYARQFEAMLANTTLDGQAWFALADYEYLAGQPVGIYSGTINIVRYDVYDYTRMEKKCVEWDGLFDCERREEVLEYCVEETLEVDVRPRLRDAATGETVFTHVYEGRAGNKRCQTDPHYGWSHGVGNYAGYGDLIDGRGVLLREALSRTLHRVRRDIAPRNVTVKAVFAAKAIDPEVAADPRFEEAVKAGLSDPVLSCSLWTDLIATYPEAPAVVHNRGACAEAEADFAAAQQFYGQAVSLAGAFAGLDPSLLAPILSSLERVSDQRYDLELLDDMTEGGDAEPPVLKPSESGA